MASTVDLLTQFTYQRGKPDESSFYMAIVWQVGVEASAGMSVQEIKAERMGELEIRGGRLSSEGDMTSQDHVADYLEDVPVTLSGPDLEPADIVVLH